MGPTTNFGRKSVSFSSRVLANINPSRASSHEADSLMVLIQVSCNVGNYLWSAPLQFHMFVENRVADLFRLCPS